MTPPMVLDVGAARTELEAAVMILRAFPDAPQAAWPHLDRAAVMLEDEPAVDQSGGTVAGRDEAAAAWRRLDELTGRLGRVDRHTGARRRTLRWAILLAVVALMATASMLVTTPRLRTVAEVGRGAIEGEVQGDAGSVVIDGGEQLVVHLGSAWNVPSFGLAVRHRMPCRVTLVRRGRPQASTELAGGPELKTYRYEVRVPVRAQRRGFEQLVITPHPAEAGVRVGGLRLDPP